MKQVRKYNSSHRWNINDQDKPTDKSTKLLDSEKPMVTRCGGMEGQSDCDWDYTHKED